MAKINMRDYYPFYEHDEYVEVSEEVAEEMAQWERDERSQRRKKYRYHAYYSLNWGDEISRQVIFHAVAPDEYYEKSVTHEQLQAALTTLSPKQRQRIYAHFVFGFSKAQIARTEGVNHRAVGLSIQRGLCKLEHHLKNIF